MTDTNTQPDVPTPEDVQGAADLTQDSTVAPEEPDYKQMLEEQREAAQARQAELESQLSQSKAASDARMAQLESLIMEIARGSSRANPQQEEIDPDDPAAQYKLAMRELERTKAELSRNDEARHREVTATLFEKEVRDVNKEEDLVVTKYKSEIDQYYNNNPNERYRPSSYRELVTYLKGQHFDELAEEQRKRAKNMVSVPSPTPTSPVGPSPAPAPDTTKEFRSADEERLARIYGRLEGKDMIPAEEWNEVRSDRNKYPGIRPRGAR